MKRILVTGGSGFIGGYVVESLHASGYRPVVFDQRWRGAAGYPADTEVFVGDVRDEQAVNQAMAHVDGWIHLAAVLGTQENVKNPRTAAVCNVMGSLNMFEAAAEFDVPGVYIGVGNHWMNNTYSITKTAAERFVMMYNKERGTRINAIRAVNAYGPRQLAAAPFGPGRVRKITPAFVCRALSGMPIEVYGDGQQVSDMVYVGDLAGALVRAGERAAAGQVFDRVVEVGPSEHQTVREVAELVNKLAAEHTGNLVDIVSLPMRPGENAADRVTADTSTLALVGMDPDALLSLEDGMRATVWHFVESMGQAWHRPDSSEMPEPARLTQS
jgi:UDP-glucose 4-epimerase